VNVYPTALDEVFRSFAEVAEYRVELLTQNAMTEIHLHVEPAHDAIDGRLLARAIREKVRSQFQLRVQVTISAPGTLPRFEMKTRRWVRVPARP
jgi:phenylacetate-CoA ligase